MKTALIKIGFVISKVNLNKAKIKIKYFFFGFLCCILFVQDLFNKTHINAQALLLSIGKVIVFKTGDLHIQCMSIQNILNNIEAKVCGG